MIDLDRRLLAGLKLGGGIGWRNDHQVELICLERRLRRRRIVGHLLYVDPGSDDRFIERRVSAAD